MAVKLESLPPLTGQSKFFIPFSDYSKWERRPTKREELIPRAPPKAKVEILQWTQKQDPYVQADALNFKGEKSKTANLSVIKPKLSSKPQEPAKIKLLKV